MMLTISSMITVFWFPAIFAAHLIATYYLFIFLSKTQGSEPTSLGKEIGILFTILHVIPQNIILIIMPLWAFKGVFPYNSGTHYSEFNIPPPATLPQSVEIFFLWYLIPNFLMSLGLILIFSLFGENRKPFAKWYQPLQSTASILVLDLLANSLLALGIYATNVLRN